MKKEDILVVGDVCINSLQWVTSPISDGDLTYKVYPKVNGAYSRGGAIFLAKLIQLALKRELYSYDYEKCKQEIKNGALVSTIELEEFEKNTEKSSSSNGKVYRVKNYNGYSLEGGTTPKLFDIEGNLDEIELLVINDDNNGFNKEKSSWPSLLENKDKPFVILYKATQLDDSNLLWKQIKEHHLDKTILIINGNDLRSRGVNISEGLSWEKTSLDFVWQMKNNPKLKMIQKCKHVIVPFGMEGAIYYNNEETPSSHLYFVTNESEGQRNYQKYGQMYGLTSCFTAGIAKSLWRNRNMESIQESIEEGIKQGMIATQKYYVNGFGNSKEIPESPSPAIFRFAEEDRKRYDRIQEVEINSNSISAGLDSWYIIKEKSSTNLADIAFEIVKYGEESALSYIPIAQFGNMKTVDRVEIEAYRSIKKLISEYIATQHAVRPLCIAVFGTPGSGKSFGITEVAESIAPDMIVKMDFNVSQFGTINDLISSFHKARDLALKDKLPLVFFDEFDSAKDSKLGWLKYFLAPMQDGVFREGDSLHPIGKAIFVFAGGTASTYEEFCGEKIYEELEKEHFWKEFKNAKGPDFISRLRGYVNILGPNQVNTQSDSLFIVRRAMLLRSLIARKVPHLINEKGEALVDNGIIRALLKIPRFKHESRSMEAILDMSTLAEAKKWEQSHLPSKEQLKLHVDENAFYNYMMKEEFYSEMIEEIAEAMYPWFSKVYRFYDSLEFSEKKEWRELTNVEKNIVYKQIKLIPTILRKINYEIFHVDEVEEAVRLTKIEVSKLAKQQHRIWVGQNKAEDAISESNGMSKPTFCMISWNKISEDIKLQMKKYIEAWPTILNQCNMRIEREADIYK